MSEQRTDEKAGYCGHCRGDSHALCVSVTCTCPNKGRRNHALRKVARGEAKPPANVVPVDPAPPRPTPTPTPKPSTPAPKATGNGAHQILRLSLDDQALDLLVRALRFTVGEANGGVDVESFDAAEHAEMLRLAETFDGARS